MILTDKENTQELYADLYAKYKITGTPYLPFRDLPTIIKKYVKGTRAVDYGCGTGESTLFLKSLGLEVTGVDINRQMLAEAKKKDPIGQYLNIMSGQIPLEKESCSLVFSSFVLLEISDKQTILSVLKDINRILKKGAIFITVLTNDNTYSHNWLTVNTNFPENAKLYSGSKVKIELRDIDLTFFDYYWTEEDYKTLIKQAELELIDIHKPLGLDSDGYEWLDEKKVAPSSIFIAKRVV